MKTIKVCNENLICLAAQCLCFWFQLKRLHVRGVESSNNYENNTHTHNSKVYRCNEEAMEKSVCCSFICFLIIIFFFNFIPVNTLENGSDDEILDTLIHRHRERERERDTHAQTYTQCFYASFETSANCNMYYNKQLLTHAAYLHII